VQEQDDHKNLRFKNFKGLKKLSNVQFLGFYKVFSFFICSAIWRALWAGTVHGGEWVCLSVRQSAENFETYLSEIVVTW